MTTEALGSGDSPGTSPGLIVDLFAGPGGWSEGLRMLGLTDVGIEFDTAACRTRAAAGHLTIQADVSQYPVERFIGRTWGLIASPPCQAFSNAGKGEGRKHAPALCAAVREERWDARPDPDPKIWLVLEPGRWVEALEPEWIAMEQVPGVLPIWQEYARTFTRWGYRAHTDVVNTANYGVPQTRKRALLLAAKGELRWPEPTHDEEPEDSLFGRLEKWISMAEALPTLMRRLEATA